MRQEDVVGGRLSGHPAAKAVQHSERRRPATVPAARDSRQRTVPRQSFTPITVANQRQGSSGASLARSGGWLPGFQGIHPIGGHGPPPIYKIGFMPIPGQVPAVILDAARYVSHSLLRLHYSSLSVYEETSSAVCTGAVWGGFSGIEAGWGISGSIDGGTPFRLPLKRQARWGNNQSGVVPGLGFHDREQWELVAQDRFAGRVQPALQDRRVDRAEVDQIFQIALIEIAQRWMPSHQSLADG